MKKLFLMVFLGNFLSCSGGGKVTEINGYTLESDPQNIEYPTLPLKSLNFEKGRSPAGEENLANGSLEKTNFQINQEDGISLRSLYFLTLYGQFLELKEISGFQKELKYCPQYHHLKASHFPEGASRANLFWNQYEGIEKEDFMKEGKIQLASFPELALPDKNGRIVWQKMNSKKNSAPHLKNALNYHAEKTYYELLILCEKGRSSHTYKFENIVTHFSFLSQEQNSWPTFSGLTKIPTVANMLLLNSLEWKEGPRSGGEGIYYSTWERKTLEKLNPSWMDVYLTSLQQEREKLRFLSKR